MNTVHVHPASTAPILRFPEGELAGRRERARKAARAAGIDVLCVTDPIDVAYFSGITTPSYVIRSRPLLMLIGSDGADTLLCSVGHVPYLSTYWHGAFEPYDGLEPVAVALLEATIARQVGDGAIGLELGPEQRMNVPVGLVSALAARWGNGRLVASADAVWAARMLKSDAEVDAIRRSALANAEALDVALAAAPLHRTEVATYRRWLTELTARGADGAHYLGIHTAPLHMNWINAAPSDRVIEAGELLWMDGGAALGGYWSDVTRTVAFDRLHPGAAAGYAQAREATAVLIDAIRPGLQASDVFDATARFLESIGQKVNPAGRVGHGIGLQLTESPSLAAFDHTVLEPGMVLAVEPIVANEHGRFAVEENLVVTETGVELLSVPCPERIPVL